MHRTLHEIPERDTVPERCTINLLARLPGDHTSDLCEEPMSDRSRNYLFHDIDGKIFVRSRRAAVVAFADNKEAVIVQADPRFSCNYRHPFPPPARVKRSYSASSMRLAGPGSAKRDPMRQ